jgi:hypothetical protein
MEIIAGVSIPAWNGIQTNASPAPHATIRPFGGFNMRKLVLAILLLLVSTSLFAAYDCDVDVRALNALFDIRDLMISRASSYTVDSRIQMHIENLRDPLPQGGYRWVMWVRPTGDAPVQKKAHLVSSVKDQGDAESFEASGDHPFEVRVVVPRKRSTFNANHAVYVKKLVVRYDRDGKQQQLDKAIDKWMAPDTSQSFDLGGIAERANAELEVATRASDVQQALAEIHFRQAVATDDPDNPHFETIQTLKSLASDLSAEKLERNISLIEKRLFPDAHFVRLVPLFEQIRTAMDLIKSEKPEEQEKGKKSLDAAIKQLDNQ